MQTQNSNDTAQEQTLVQFPQSSQRQQTQTVQPVTQQDFSSQNQPVQQSQMWEPATVAKEQEPFPNKPLDSEVLTASEAPSELEPEIEQVGVKDNMSVPQISEELQKAGVVPSGSGVPVPAQQQAPQIKLPIDPVRAQQITKGFFIFKNPSSSLLWLAMMVLRQLQLKQKGEKHVT